MAKKKTREQLMERFREGARPSGNDFADFIESMVNRDDDGIEKPSLHEPVRITTLNQDRNILDLADADDSLAWRLKLADDTGNPGLNLVDSSGKSRLFVDKETGNVGVGTCRPQATLDVEGTVRGIPVVDFQKVSWSFRNQVEPTTDIPVAVNFPGKVLKAEAMLGSWRIQYERRERIKDIGIEITNLEIDDNVVRLVVQCTLENATWFFTDYYNGRGDVIVVATLEQAFHDEPTETESPPEGEEEAE